jgi:hypothetical protein
MTYKWEAIAQDLTEERDRLRIAVQTAINAFALMAYRDSGDPELLKGWRNLQEQMRAALKSEKQ